MAIQGNVIKIDYIGWTNTGNSKWRVLILKSGLEGEILFTKANLDEIDKQAIKRALHTDKVLTFHCKAKSNGDLVIQSVEQV